VWLQGGSIILQKSSTVQAPAIRICAVNLVVQDNAQLLASNGGCGPQTGFGAGSSQVGLPSSGAGHGGVGGMSSDGQGDTLTGGPWYDNVTGEGSQKGGDVLLTQRMHIHTWRCAGPVMVGSGGGDTILGGSGGGIIYMDVAGVFDNSGTVAATAYAG